MPAVVRLRRALRASQVHQRQLPRRVRLTVVVTLRSRHPNLEHGVRPRGHGVGASLLRLSTRVAFTQQLEDGVLVVDGDVGQAADHGAAFGIFPQLQRGRVGHEQVVHELVVHLGVGALHLVIFLPAVARDEAKDVAKREHHEPRIPLIPHHGVRLTAARGAVREHRGVRSPEHSRDVREDGSSVHLLVGSFAVVGGVKHVAPLLLADSRGHLLALERLRYARHRALVCVLVGVQDDDAALVDELGDGARAVGHLLARQRARPDGHLEGRLGDSLALQDARELHGRIDELLHLTEGLSRAARGGGTRDAGQRAGAVAIETRFRVFRGERRLGLGSTGARGGSGAPFRRR